MERVLGGGLLTNEDLVAWWSSIEYDLVMAGFDHAAICAADKRQVYLWHAKLQIQAEQAAKQPKPQVVGVPVVVGRR